ncbi:MAG: ribonuclease Y [Deferribacteraceae bacterium]|jgi:ribonuclease Y|nr:ribonuclease Y [Deferribacteraceae bacterium]
MQTELALVLFIIAVFVLSLAIGFVVGYRTKLKMVEMENIKLSKTHAELNAAAKREAEEIIKEAKLEAKEVIFKGRQDMEKEAKEKRKEFNQLERKLDLRDEALDKKQQNITLKEELLEKHYQEYEQKMKEAAALQQRNEEIKTALLSEVERVAAMTREEAKRSLIDQMIEEAKSDSARRIKEIEEELKEESDKKARSIISTAIQRCAPEYVGEISVTVVNLPSEDMKGRIIGREGRNIRAFESVTGVDIIVDDTPEAVILSSYDPFRREIGRLTLEKLIADGRIHPARIEELYDKSSKELDKQIKEIGDEAVFQLGLHNISPEIIKLIGRLRYRTSYGQNVLGHSLEVAKIAGFMAAELGMNEKVAKRAGLLHDIGKAVDYEQEGSHTTIGVGIAKRYKEDWRVVNAIASHHGEEEFKCVEAVLVQAADAISASRPGARREVLESYIKRLEKLEEVASSFEGVTRSFAIQAGREVRIIVEPEKVSDEAIINLSRDISRKVEEELTYPGQIKVTVIRESRSVNYAR